MRPNHGRMPALGLFRIRAFVILCLVAVLCTIAGGCGKPADQAGSSVVAGDETGAESSGAAEAEPEEPPLPEPPPAELSELLPKAWEGDFDGMVKRRLIRALVTYNRTAYFLDGPRERGITYEALRAFEEHLNKKLDTGTLKLHVVVVPTTRDRLLPDLLAGRGDLIAANLTITPERLEQVDFSVPAYDQVDELIVTGPTGPELATLDDLAGKEVWVRTTSSFHPSLVSLNERLRSAGKAPVEIQPADERLETEDILEMTAAGVLGITVADSHVAQFWSEVLDGLVVHPDLKVRTGGQIGWAFRKGSPKLAAEVNEFIEQNKKGTFLGNVLIKRYLKTNPWVKNPTTEQELARFRELIDYFKRYAGDYDFDWLMMAAQGYQESGLDQSVRSPVGAIGVMQVMPTTATDPAVGIPDIENTEKNIHAGIKYMRYILEHYFPDAKMSDVDKHLFAFASYNAGPNRIARLRKQAAAEGLDPDVWFDSVERVVAREVGRETVTYVSNIYKYYLAYKLIQEQGLKKPRA